MKLLTALAAALVLNFGAINSMDAAAPQEKGSNIMATEDFSTVFARGEKMMRMRNILLDKVI